MFGLIRNSKKMCVEWGDCDGCPVVLLPCQCVQLVLAVVQVTLTHLRPSWTRRRGAVQTSQLQPVGNTAQRYNTTRHCCHNPSPGQDGLCLVFVLLGCLLHDAQDCQVCLVRVSVLMTGKVKDYTRE